MSLYQTNFTLNNYFLKCDQINKYNYLNTQELLKVKTLNLSVDLENLKTLDFSKKVNVFIFIYSVFGIMPFINYNKKTIRNLNRRTKTIFSSLDIMTSQSHVINSFLFSIFVENWDLFAIESFSFKDKKEFANNCYSFCFSTRMLSELNNFLPIVLSDLDVLNFEIKLKFKNPTILSELKIDSLIKNFPLFWISG